MCKYWPVLKLKTHKKLHFSDNKSIFELKEKSTILIFLGGGTTAKNPTPPPLYKLIYWVVCLILYNLSGMSDPLNIEWYVWFSIYWVLCLILYILSGMSDPLYIEWYDWYVYIIDQRMVWRVPLWIRKASL